MEIKKHNISIGQKFGQWTIISYSHKNNHYQHFWACSCSCGYESILEQSRLNNGNTTCCKVCANALRRKYKPVEVGNYYGDWTVLREDENNKNFAYAQCKCGSINRFTKKYLAYGQATRCHACAATKHGHNSKKSPSPEYRAWLNAKNRIFNSKIPNYVDYGGRGIIMCQRWADSFENFLQDVGLKPSAKHSLERIDNNGNYEPGNVRWALPLDQVRNRRITFRINGEYINTKQLARELNIHEKTIKNLLITAKYTIEEVQKFSKLTHYQKIEMGKSIKNNQPLPFATLEKIKSPVPPSPKRHPLWSTWHSMKQRCNNPKNKDYHNYGAKGIEVCAEWTPSFKMFLYSLLATIGNKPSSQHQLDRIDNNKHYEPNNVRWATKEEQAKNKQNTVYLDGKGVSAGEIGLRYGISGHTVIKLTRLGWNEDGIRLFSRLSFKQKKFLKIFANRLSQEDAIAMKIA